MRKLLHFLIASAFGVAILFQCKTQEKPVPQIVELTPEEVATSAERIRQEVPVELADDLELELWAPDALVTDPIAISVDDRGRIYYTQANRLEHSEFDIRGHRNWMTASISFETVEDRRAFIKKTFSETNEEGERFLTDLNGDSTLDWRDLTVEKEQVWIVEDRAGSGRADRAQKYVEDFHEEISDLANGVEYSAGEVFLAVGPDLWRLKDNDGDDIADEKESISHGFAVHIGFGAHGMSGVKIGPDGRVWWGIGDIGMNVIDKEGKQWKYPNQGVIVRCERDGTGFEVYSAGLRNTHEFVFDKYGNLITEDNDGDHSGERERLVYLLNGSETGWRINWQFGKYTDPKNNSYKVWMDEKLNVPRWDGQAAYVLPCIQNYVNGPTGMVYNPGTALSPAWADHFFIAEFRGSPANSPIHAFTLRPDGAGFALDSTRAIAKGLLPTGLDFGPDGALYFADWIDGWGTKDEGRLWKLDVPGGAQSEIRQETQKLIQSDFGAKNNIQLAELLGHSDMRIRQRSQFELAAREEEGLGIFREAAQQKENQLARVHALWGIAQQARKNIDLGVELVPYLTDSDAEIQAQAAKMIGDIRYAEASEGLKKLLQHGSLRVRMMAIEALGRNNDKSAVQEVLAVMEENNDEDAWLRHSGMIALGRIGDAAAMVALKNSPSRALRTVAVVALRRMRHPGIADFLTDEDEYIVAEAARGINDDYSIEEALPALARTLQDERFTAVPLVRRAINANLRVGQQENLDMLIAYSRRKSAPADLRAEAIACLSTWSEPSLHDRVDGRYRGEIMRDAGPARQSLIPVVSEFLDDRDAAVSIAATQLAARFDLEGSAQELEEMMISHEDADVRKAALAALHEMGSGKLDEHLATALKDKDEKVRSYALEILPDAKIDEDKAMDLFESILQTGSKSEKQAALGALTGYTGKGAVDLLAAQWSKFEDGTLDANIRLDVIDAVETQGNEELIAQVYAYEQAKYGDDPLGPWQETIAGGNRSQGQRIFYRNEAAQCARCHRIFEYGGDAGPGLGNVGARLTPDEILESLILPSASYAKGYQVLSLELADGSIVAGIVEDETDDLLRLKIAEDNIREISITDIASRTEVPSAMPGVENILTKKQVRDLIAYLVSLKAEEG